MELLSLSLSLFRLQSAGLQTFRVLKKDNTKSPGRVITTQQKRSKARAVFPLTAIKTREKRSAMRRRC
jgi:hypothetical protein